MKTNQIFIMFFIVASAAITGCNNNSRNDDYSWSTNTNTQSSSSSSEETASTDSWRKDEQEENQKNDAIGTWSFTDEIGHTWTLVLNDDMTATCKLNGSDRPAYGSWKPTNYLDNAPGLEFNDQMPRVWFKGGEESLYLPAIVDGYIYDTGSDAKAKNPQKRLKISKISSSTKTNDSKTSKPTSSSKESSLTETSSSRKEDEEIAKKKAVGTYKFTDEIGHTWVLVLKSDMTATCKYSEGDTPAYGSWKTTNYLDNAPTLEFSDQRPRVWFKGGEESLFLPAIVDGYIYDTGSDAQAKNPRKRLKITKIK